MSITEALSTAYAPLHQAWGDLIPPATERAREIADHALDGKLYFYDVHLTDVGRRDIDWSAPQHKHQEWPAQLNRQMILATLASVYRETGDERYAEAARDFIADWMRTHPTRPDWAMARYDSVLNLCIRVGNSQHQGWLGTLPVFQASPAFEAAFVDAMLASCAAQLDCLIDNIANSINWRIANADCLLLSGLRLAHLPGAERWRTFGLGVLNDAWHRQVLPDGAHMERNPSYHNWMANVMANYWKLGRVLPELGLVMETERVARMFDYSVANTRPNGSLNALHDCTGERTGSYPNDPMARRAAFRAQAGLPEALPPTAQYFPDAGQVLLRDRWTEDATYLVFDATNWGGSHCHLSRNSVQVHALGRSLLVDPGTLTYEGSDPLSAHGKSTRVHNTLSLNGWNQGETNPQITTVMHGEGFDYVTSEYEGAYWSGPYRWGFDQGRGEGVQGSHRRTLLWAHDRAIFVIDSLYREPAHQPEVTAPSLEMNWQLSEGGEVELGAGRVTARYGDANLLMLFPLAWPEMTLSVHAGERDPLRGWLPVAGGFVPAPQVTLSCAPMPGQYAELITVLLPFAGEVPRVTAHATKTDGQRPAVLTLEWADGTRDELWHSYRGLIMLGETAGYRTDGGLLYLRRDARGVVVRGCAAEATYLAPCTSTVLPVPGMITF